MIMMKSLFLTVIALLLISNSSSEATLYNKYNAIFNFGDSYSDTGNALLAGVSPDFSYFSKLPYGQTFFGRPTGRCSDGRLIVDFLAEGFGLPYLIPYLSDTHIGTGANFAVAGATALDSEFFFSHKLAKKVWTNNSLSVQLGWFKKLKHSLCATQQDCDRYFKKSIFLLGEIGENDYNLVFFSGGTIKQIEPLVPLVIEAITNATIVLIEEGALELVVPGSFPLGCSTVFLALFPSTNKTDYDSMGCLRAFNAFSEFHNSLLKASLDTLRTIYPNARIVYADFFGATIRFVQDPEQFGFDKETFFTICCGGGGPNNFNPKVWCSDIGSTTCDDPSSYANWDSIHLTEAAYRIMAESILSGPFTDPPLFDHPAVSFIR